MDEHKHLSLVQRGNANVHDIHPRTTITVNDLRLLEIVSLEQIGKILKKYCEVSVPREHVDVFKWRITSDPQSWFVEAGNVGLIYLTNLIPNHNAVLNVLFWDQSLGRDRVECVKTVIGTAFDMFQLQRLTMYVTGSNVPLRRVVSKIGFVLEGCTRRGQVQLDGSSVDLIQYGMLREETPPCLAMTISSAHP